MSPETKTQLDVLWLGLTVATLRVILEALPPLEELVVMGLIPPVLAVLTLALALPLALGIWWGRIMPGICLVAILAYALLMGVPLSALPLALAIGAVAGLLLGLLWNRMPQTTVLVPFLILVSLLLPFSPIPTFDCPPLTLIGFLLVATTWLVTTSLVIPQPKLALAVRIVAYVGWLSCGWYVILATRSAASPSVGPVGWLIALGASAAAIAVAYFVERLLALGLCPRLPGWQAGGWVEQLGAARRPWPSQRLDRVSCYLNGLDDADHFVFVERLVQTHIPSVSVPEQHRVWLNDHLTELARHVALCDLRRLAVQYVRLSPRRGIDRVAAHWIAELAIWHWSQFDEMVVDLVTCIPAQDPDAKGVAAYALGKVLDTLPAAERRFLNLLIWCGHLRGVAPTSRALKTSSPAVSQSQAEKIDRWHARWADRNRSNHDLDIAWKAKGDELLLLTCGPTIVPVLAEEALAARQAGHTLAALDLLAFVENRFPHHAAEALVPALRARIEGDYLESQGWLRSGSLSLGLSQSLFDARRMRLENESDGQPLAVLLLGPDSRRLELAAGEAAIVSLLPGDYSLIVYSDTAETKPCRCAWAVVPEGSRQGRLLLS